MRLILRQQQAGPPPVCPPVAGVRPELARITVAAPTLSAYDALLEGLLMATAIAEPPHLAADLKDAVPVDGRVAVAGPWPSRPPRQRQGPADYLAQLAHLEVDRPAGSAASNAASRMPASRC